MSHPRRILLVGLSVSLLAALTLGAVAQVAPPEKPGDKPAEPAPAITLPADASLRRTLETGEDFLKDEDWERVAEVVQRLFDRSADGFVEVRRKGPDGKEVRQMSSARAEADRLYERMPARGREMYRLKYGPAAAELLKEAKAKKAPEALEPVVRRFAPTDAGAEALALLAMHHFDIGHVRVAALLAGVPAPPPGLKPFDPDYFGPAVPCFARLLDHPAGAAHLTPLVLFKAAIAFRQAGDPRSAERTMKLLAGKLGKDGLQMGKRTLNLEQLHKELDRLTAPPPVAVEWPIFRGSSARLAQSVGGTPFLEAKWRQPTIRSAETRRYIDQAVKQREGRSDAILPAFHAILAQDKVIYRNFWGIHAIDLKKEGKFLWETPSHWGLDRMLTASNKASAATQWINQYFSMNRHHVLWENSTVGTLSTDGERIYAVEDLVLPPANVQAYGNPWGTNRNLPFGQEINAAISSSRLQAIELPRGKFLWEVGGPTEKRGRAEPAGFWLALVADVEARLADELKDSYFLGPPLPLNGKLYVLNEKDQKIRLVCLDTTRGMLLWTLPLAVPAEKLIDAPGRRMQAAPLAYGNGVLVCPTNSGAVVGVDLLARSPLWAHVYREGPGAIAPAGSNSWKASAPIIADGKVVFTAPDASAVHCLNLRDGALVWKAERADKDLYLAGVIAGKVLTVGRESARALDLNNGKQLWQLPTGLPSGLGVASANVYYLPLKAAAASKEPEVCAIDVERGIVAAHTKSRKKEVPGNLLFYEGDVISQTVSEVCAYPQLKAKLEEIDALLKKDPKGPAALTERSVLKVDSGDLIGAVEDLRAALANNPPKELLPRVRTKLYEALTELLQRDFNKGEKYLDEYKGLLKIDIAPNEPAAERQRLEAEQNRRRAGFHLLLGKGYEQQARLADAFDAYLAFAAVPADDLVGIVDDPARKVRPEVLAQGRIAALLAKEPEQRKPLEERIERRWQEAKKANDLANLRRFVATFGSLTPAGREARLLLAERGDAGDFLEAERHLLLLRAQKDDRPLAGRAVEALAQLMAKRGLLEDAGHYYQVLGRDFAKVVVRDGKTGADLFADLATDKRFLPFLEDAKPAVQGKVKVVEQRGVNQQTPSTYTFPHAGEPLPFLDRHRVALNLNFHQLKLFDADTNEEKWSQRLQQTNFQNLLFAGPAGVNPRFACYNVGHLVVLPLSHLVFGIDPVNKRVLWERSLIDSAGVPAGANIVPDPKDGTPQLVYKDGTVQRLDPPGLVGPAAVVLLTRDRLTALDPVSGQTIWMRSDVSPQARVFGDDRHLLVVETNPAGVRAFRTSDGAAVKVPDFARVYLASLRTLGTNLLLSEADEKAVTLRLYDALAGQDVWKKELPAGSVVLRTEEPDLTGVITPDGKLTALDALTGQELLRASVEFKHVTKAQAVYLLRDRLNYYVLPNQPFDGSTIQGVRTDRAAGEDLRVWTNLAPGSGLRELPVNGEVHAFRRDTGELVWHIPVEHQMLIASRFQDMPMLLFTARYQKWAGNAANRFPVQAIAVRSVDKQSGKLLYDQPEMVNGTQFFALNVDRKARRFELVGFNLKIVHTLAE